MALLDIFKKRKEGERFQKKQREKKETEQIEKKPEALKKASTFAGSAGEILKKPHITEKATYLKEKNVYVFKISPRANKVMIKKAIKDAYGVRPKKIAIINIPSKKRFVRGKFGTKSGFKKAMVYLKEGDKIEIS